MHIVPWNALKRSVIIHIQTLPPHSNVFPFRFPPKLDNRLSCFRWNHNTELTTNDKWLMTCRQMTYDKLQWDSFPISGSPIYEQKPFGSSGKNQTLSSHAGETGFHFLLGKFLFSIVLIFFEIPTIILMTIFSLNIFPPSISCLSIISRSDD